MGAPVSPETAESLEKAMERSISLQPHVKNVVIRINREMLTRNTFGYGELEGRAICAEVEIEYEGETVRARLEHDRDRDYPMMRLF